MNVERCPAVIVQRLGAGYPSDRDAIHDINFVVHPGERVSIIGPNGAGKSTLFKAIAGLVAHHTGEISIHGYDCRSSHSMVGYVPQYEDIDWHFPVTVNDVVMMGRVRKIGMFRWPVRRDYQEVERRLEQVGMAQFRQRQIGELSGGQKRRVFIARALAQETDVLLLDEPFSGVDASAEQEILATLDVLRAAGVTVLLATHDLGMATSQFDKLMLLKRTIIAYGQPEEVFTPQNLRAAYGGRIGVFHQGDEVIILADEHGHGD
ncbi:MAG: metal ABC transporter ATP-binding protein [Chloroflexi bacterium]|nr:metal ABC transporter ATP-binding protein [Chloroflexota bacterium]